MEPERDGSTREGGGLDAEAMELEVRPDVLDGRDDAGDSGGVSLAFADGAHAGPGAFRQLWGQLAGMPGVLGRMESLEDGHRVGAGIEFGEVEVVSRGEFLVERSWCCATVSLVISSTKGSHMKSWATAAWRFPQLEQRRMQLAYSRTGRCPWPRVMRLKAPGQAVRALRPRAPRLSGDAPPMVGMRRSPGASHSGRSQSGGSGGG